MAVDIKPRVDDDGVPWCDAGCPMAGYAPHSLPFITCTVDDRERCCSDDLMERECCHISVRRMAEELQVTNKLLDERNRLLDAIPECEVHGKGCVPSAIEQVRRMVVDLQEFKDELLRIALAMPFASTDPDSLIAGVRRMSVELEAWRRGRLHRYGNSYITKQVVYHTIDAAVAALMAEREEK